MVNDTWHLMLQRDLIYGYNMYNKLIWYFDTRFIWHNLNRNTQRYLC